MKCFFLLLYSFSTRAKNGLLLYNGRYNEHNDYLALELLDGQIQFSFSLGANVSRVVLEHPATLHDGNWHTITVNYVNRVSFAKPFNIEMSRNCERVKHNLKEL